MIRTRVLAVLLAAALAPSVARAQVPAPAPAPPLLPAVQLPPELDRVLRDYERNWAAGNAAALADIFTDDGFVPTRTGWVRGREAIRSRYANAGGNLVLQAHAYAVSDTVGYIVGAFGYGGGRANGKFILALRRAPGGQWLIAADLDQ